MVVLQQLYERLSDEDKVQFWSLLHLALLRRGGDPLGLNAITSHSHVTAIADLIREKTGVEIEVYT